MRKVCPYCGTEIHEPFIRCVECVPEVDLCLSCFAKGKEFGTHKNDHDYEVRQSNFSLLEDDWSATEELKLLDSLVDLGYGNWSEVSKQLRTKSEEECQRHYTHNFIDNPEDVFATILPPLALGSAPKSERREIAFRFSDDPPRPMPMSDMATEIAGYMPCRGDFDVEYDNFAETSIKDIDFNDDDDELSIELKFAAIDIFYSRLKERHFRKQVIRKYGLINILKDSLASYNKQERMIREAMRVFTRFQCPEKCEMFLQGIIHQSNLMKQIKLLQGYRKAGLEKKQSAGIFKKLHNTRQESKTKRTLVSEISCHVDMPMSCQLWLKKQLQSQANDKVIPAPSMFPQLSRKPAAPLDLSGMPGVEQLNDEEKILCSQIRLPPLQYLNHKSTLINEGERLGSLRLQQARPLIKIDVNKTKKLYDYFIEQGWINAGFE